MTHTALTISLSDSSGVAGIQADIKTFAANHVHGASVIAGIAAENTQRIDAIFPVSDDVLAQQLASLNADLDIHAVKLGSLFSAGHARTIITALDAHSMGPLVVDPTINGYNGRPFMSDGAFEAMKELLFPRAEIVIPNVNELGIYSGCEQANNEDDVIAQARIILAMGPNAVLATGGYREFTSEAVDILVTGSNVIRLSGARVRTRNLRGTSCTLSSAIAAGLAKGETLELAVRRGKGFISAAIAAGTNYSIGMGAGPVHPFYATWKL
jgi:hydroxymethylpyrimidine/phosphomethylpyrimidine kinase